MNPLNLITPELVNHCKQFNTIVVCGFTKTGKGIIAKELANQLNRQLLMSDDFGFEGYDDFRNVVLSVYNKRIPIVIEGVLCFRLLRKGIQENNFHPDLLIRTNCNESTIRYFYEHDGEASKINRVMSYNKGLNTIWDEYRELLKSDLLIKRPIYIELNTSI